jgi:hypothetical protein
MAIENGVGVFFCFWGRKYFLEAFKALGALMAGKQKNR